MDGRKRTVQLKFRVTEAERDLILEKMKLIPTRNMAAYLRKIAIDGYIIQIDHSDIKAMTADNIGGAAYPHVERSCRNFFVLLCCVWRFFHSIPPKLGSENQEVILTT